MNRKLQVGMVVLALVGLVWVTQRAAREQAAASQARVPVLVEMFTSEGCPACPPADRFLMDLEETQPVPGVEVIALGHHVDYWNQRGWVDAFARPELTQRQREYAAFFGNQGLYTPQMVVDGRAEFVGADVPRALGEILLASRRAKARVEARLAAGAAGAKEIAVDVKVEQAPPMTAGESAEVLLAVTENRLTSNITTGPNAGRVIRHASVVRELRAIGALAEQSPATFAGRGVFTPADGWHRENLRAVVIVQEKNSRRVVGVAVVPLAGE